MDGLRKMAVMIVICFCWGGCGRYEESSNLKGEKAMDSLTVTSQSFSEAQMIPSKYTADGENISPGLKWKSVPEATVSIAVISDDPDAPMGTWVHWVVYNIPAGVDSLAENASGAGKLPEGAEQGRTDFGSVGYGGPAPPSGTHRYYFKVYALDTALKFDKPATKKELLEAMQGHILAYGSLMGKYKRR